jgi:Protein of unknown function (DUF3892)
VAGRFQITCINKPDRNSSVEHITHVGGSTWKLTVETVMQRIESTGSDHENFYVRVGGTETDVIVVAASANKRKHIRTKPDATQRDNLLALPECP